MPITIDASAAPRSLVAPLRALVALTLKRAGRRAGEIGVRLTDDPELRELNRRWRRIDRATDVISFAYEEDAPDAARRPVTGDIVVSMERVIEQAKRYHDTPGTELARLVIHGVLHLAGHDHMKPGERVEMRAREDATLAAAKAIVRRMDAVPARAPRVAAPAKRRALAKPAMGRAPARPARRAAATPKRRAVAKPAAAGRPARAPRRRGV